MRIVPRATDFWQRTFAAAVSGMCAGRIECDETATKLIVESSARLADAAWALLTGAEQGAKSSAEDPAARRLPHDPSRHSDLGDPTRVGRVVAHTTK